MQLRNERVRENAKAIDGIDEGGRGRGRGGDHHDSESKNDHGFREEEDEEEEEEDEEDDEHGTFTYPTMLYVPPILSVKPSSFNNHLSITHLSLTDQTFELEPSSTFLLC